MSSEEYQLQTELSLTCRMSELAIKDNRTNQRDRNIDQENRRDELEKRMDARMKQSRDIFIRDMNDFGISVLDDFLGQERGDMVYEEVLRLHQSGLLQEGQLVKNNEKNHNIRSDLIVWLRGKEEQFPNIRKLINDIDRIVMTACKTPNNGKLGEYDIRERTGVMVACYPGKGAHFVKHIDNPHGDGRVITAIYYLNKDWNTEKHGGLLRIFPADKRTDVADIVPIFDRMLFFWSDKSNPHEVQPSYRTRYAITIWYYDSGQKTEAMKMKLRQKQVSLQRNDFNGVSENLKEKNDGP